MSREVQELRRKFEARLREAAEASFYGVVKSVDEKNRICNVQVGGVVHEGVLLYAVETPEQKGFHAIPKIGSMVIVARIAGSNRLHVAMFSEIDKVVFTVGDRVTIRCDGERIEASASEIILNGGELGGLLNIVPLTEKINEIIDALNNHTHAIPSGGVSVAGSATAQSNPAPVSIPAPTAKHRKVKRDDYEDTKIKH